MITRFTISGRTRRRMQGIAPARFPLPYSGLGTVIYAKDGGVPVGWIPDAYKSDEWPTGGVKIPLPSGTTITVAVTPTPTPTFPGSVPAGPADKLRSWLQESTIIAGRPNWQVAGAVAIFFMLVKR